MGDKIKIAFYNFGAKGWYAGTVQLKGILYSMHRVFDGSVEFYPTGLTYSDIPHEIIEISGEFIRIQSSDEPYTTRMIHKIARRLFPRYNFCAESVLKRHGINVVFGHILKYRYGSIPSISLVHDFQHKYFPEMFTMEERRERDREFYLTAKLASRVIVMSQSVKDDFGKFLPQYVNKVTIVPAATYIPGSVYMKNPAEISSMYNLPEKFIYLPNQFWKHKNHEMAFEAVRILKERGVRVNLVCTGYSRDYRDPEGKYFAGLFRRISEWNLESQIVYLGMIPYEHVILLMRRSVAVINPSLFEGFGLSVNEAQLFGKKILVSDIPSFREQYSPGMMFFEPMNAEEIAEKMADVWQNALPGPDLAAEEKARGELPEKIKKSACSFMSVIKEIVK